MGKGVRGRRDEEPSTDVKQKGRQSHAGDHSRVSPPGDEGGENQGGNAPKRWGPRQRNPKSSGSKCHPSVPSPMGHTEGDTGTARRETRHPWGDAHAKHGARVLPPKTHHPPEQRELPTPPDPQIHSPPLKETRRAPRKAKPAPTSQPAQGAAGPPRAARGESGEHPWVTLTGPPQQVGKPRHGQLSRGSPRGGSERAPIPTCTCRDIAPADRKATFF